MEKIIVLVMITCSVMVKNTVRSQSRLFVLVMITTLPRSRSLSVMVKIASLSLLRSRLFRGPDHCSAWVKVSA